jgi:hypothetical protein
MAERPRRSGPPPQAEAAPSMKRFIGLQLGPFQRGGCPALAAASSAVHSPCETFDTWGARPGEGGSNKVPFVWCTEYP